MTTYHYVGRDDSRINQQHHLPIALLNRHEIYIGDLERVDMGELVEIDNTSFGDHFGSTIERSNYRVFMDRFGYLVGVFDLFCDMSEHSIIVTRFALHNYEGMRESIDQLREGDCMDDDDRQGLEDDIEDETWVTWLFYDLKKALKGAGIYDDDSMPEDTELKRLFYVAADDAGEYAEFEDAFSCYWDISRIIEHWPERLEETEQLPLDDQLSADSTSVQSAVLTDESWHPHTWCHGCNSTRTDCSIMRERDRV